jgi:FkbM family methyltransferase
MQTLASPSLWIARNRSARKALGFLLPDTGLMEVVRSFSLAIDLRDKTGPSFYVAKGGPAAFYHYEEAEKAEILQSLPPEGVFFDVGANIGLFTYFVSRYFPQARVFSFEPNPRLFECLTQTRSHNHLSNVILTQACLGDRSGEIELHLHDQNSGGHTTRRDQIGAHETSKSIEVKILPLDEVVKAQKLERLNVIKIDVQGAEWDVLKGACESIKRFQPKVVIELDNQELVQKRHLLTAYFGSLSLDHYRIRRCGELLPLELFEAARMAQEDLDRGLLHTNYVLLPG